MNKLEKSVLIRMTEQTHNEIERNAKKEGTTVSHYLRTLPTTIARERDERDGRMTHEIERINERIEQLTTLTEAIIIRAKLETLFNTLMHDEEGQKMRTLCELAWTETARKVERMASCGLIDKGG